MKIRERVVRALVVALGLAAALVSFAPPSSAAEPTGSGSAAGPEAGPTEAQTRALEKYDQGVAAFDQGRYEEAVALFLQADEIAHSAAFAFNAGLAYEKMGDLQKAARWSREYLKRKPNAPDRASVEARIKGYEKALREQGVQQLTVVTEPPDASVTLDGKDVGVTPWTGEIMAGEHKVLVQLPGYWKVERTFKSGKDRPVKLTLQLLSDKDVGPGAPRSGGTGAAAQQGELEGQLPDEGAAPEGGTTSATAVVGGVSLALGIGGFVGAVAMELSRSAAESDARDAETQIEAGDALDTMKDRRLVAQVLAGVGAGLTALGAVLLIVDLTSDKSEEPGTEPGASPTETTARAFMDLGCMAGSCGVRLRGAF